MRACVRAGGWVGGQGAQHAVIGAVSVSVLAAKCKKHPYGQRGFPLAGISLTWRMAWV